MLLSLQILLTFPQPGSNKICKVDLLNHSIFHQKCNDCVWSVLLLRIQYRCSTSIISCLWIKKNILHPEITSCYPHRKVAAWGQPTCYVLPKLHNVQHWPLRGRVGQGWVCYNTKDEPECGMPGKCHQMSHKVIVMKEQLRELPITPFLNRPHCVLTYNYFCEMLTARTDLDRHNRVWELWHLSDDPSFRGRSILKGWLYAFGYLL